MKIKVAVRDVENVHGGEFQILVDDMVIDIVEYNRDTKRIARENANAFLKGFEAGFTLRG